MEFQRSQDHRSAIANENGGQNNNGFAESRRSADGNSTNNMHSPVLTASSHLSTNITQVPIVSDHGEHVPQIRDESVSEDNRIQDGAVIVSNRLSAKAEETHKQVYLMNKVNSMADPALVSQSGQSFSNRESESSQDVNPSSYETGSITQNQLGVPDIVTEQAKEDKNSASFIKRLFERGCQEKRRSPSVDNEEASADKRVRRSLYLDILPVKRRDRLKNLETLGADWLEFYNIYVTSPGLSSDDVYHIMAWVSAIGCPQVMLDIADRRRSMSEQTFESLRLDSDVSKAYCLHGKIEGSIMSSHFQKCLLEIFIYLRFKTLHGQHQSTIKDNRKVRQRKGHRRLQSTPPTSKIYKAAHYALNDLVAECLNITTEHVERGAYQAERRKISMLKEQGRALLSFSELLKEKDKCVDIWRLFPMRKIRTPLDVDITVDVNRYVACGTVKKKLLTLF